MAPVLIQNFHGFFRRTGGSPPPRSYRSLPFFSREIKAGSGKPCSLASADRRKESSPAARYRLASLFLRERKRTARLHRAAKARSRAGCTSRHGRGFSDIVLIGERSCRQAIIIKRGDGNDGFSRKGICPGGHGSPGFRGPLSAGAVDGPGAVGDS